MAKTVVALFDRFSDAHGAIRDLRESERFSKEDLTLMAHDAARRYSGQVKRQRLQDIDPDTHADVGAATGAGVGAAVGGIAGLLIGTGVILIPGVGPVLAAGPLVATLMGATAGAVAGGLIGVFVGLGIPEEEAHIFAEGLRRGGTLVLVRASDDRVDDAVEILWMHHPVDIEKRTGEWTNQGWSGQFQETGDVQKVDRDDLEVARQLEPGRPKPYEYGVPEDVALAQFRRYEPVFRAHFEEHGVAARYPSARVGYQFGTELGAEQRHGNESWEAIEAEARQRWAEQSDDPWETAKHFVKFAYLKTKDALWGPDNWQSLEAPGSDEQRLVHDFRRHFAEHGDDEAGFEETSDAYEVGTRLAAEPALEDEPWNRVRVRAQRQWQEADDHRPFDRVERYVKYGWKRAKDTLSIQGLR